MRTKTSICKYCHNTYNKKQWNQLFCSQKCLLASHGKKNRVSEKKHCKFCKKEFETKRKAEFCSQLCRGKYEYRRLSPEEKRKKIQYQIDWKIKKGLNKPKKSNFQNFGDLYFRNENDFEKWFKNNFALFGLKKLIKIDRMFPDVVAETYKGKRLSIELEFSALNFKDHGHDPNMCDLIISYIKPFTVNDIRGVPIIAIFNAKNLAKGTTNYDFDSLSLTSYFRELIDIFQEQLESVLNG